MIKNFNSHVVMILVACLACLALHTTLVLQKNQQEQKTCIDFTNTTFQVPISFLYPEEFSFKQPKESHYLFSFLSILSIIFIFLAAHFEVQRLFDAGMENPSYRGQKIQVLSACCHPPTIFFIR